MAQLKDRKEYSKDYLGIALKKKVWPRYIYWRRVLINLVEFGPNNKSDKTDLFPSLQTFSGDSFFWETKTSKPEYSELEEFQVEEDHFLEKDIGRRNVSKKTGETNCCKFNKFKT